MHKAFVKWVLPILLVVILLGGVVYILIPAVLGKSTSGSVANVSDLPLIGTYVDSLKVEGKVVYAVTYHPHGGYTLAIAGKTDVASAKEFCRQLGLTWSSEGGDMFNNKLYHQANVAENKDDLWRGGFGRNDYLISGQNHQIGNVSGALRQSDGYFSLVIVSGN